MKPKPEAAIAIMMTGAEFGFSAMQSFRLINVIKGKPTLIILDTIKGKCLSFAENTAAYHNGSFDKEKYAQAVAELEAQKEAI